MYDPYKPMQVSEAVSLFNEALSLTYPAVLVEGEVSSFKVNQGKYVFFELKDKEGTLSCFMMRTWLAFPLHDGMKVRVAAEPNITMKGRFSLTVREVTPVGEGGLKKAYDELKNLLEKEGLFAQDRKRSLPYMPQRIGVVSSEQAAGYADFIKVITNRWPGINIVLAHVPVQGVEAPTEIIGAISHLNQLSKPVDVIAVIRGGGSADDLVAFNHEGVVRAVSGSKVPVVTGVGHEVDTTLADLAADLRAATPSNAAELLVPEKATILHSVSQLTEQALHHSMAIIEGLSAQGEYTKDGVARAVSQLIEGHEERFRAVLRAVKQCDPHAVLRRGYGVVMRRGADPILRAADATIGESIIITMQDGNIISEVTDVKYGK